MGIALSYTPNPKPTAAQLVHMNEEARDLRPLHRWWSEPLRLIDVPKLGTLGLTKVSLQGYSSGDGYVEVEQEEDFLMIWSDISHIVQTLSRWSRDFGFTWELQLEGAPFGTIDSLGNASNDLDDNLAQLLEASAAPLDPGARSQLIEAIDRKYASRWG